MSLINNPKWLSNFAFNYERPEHIPQKIFNEVNQDLDKIQNGKPLISVIIAAWNEEINILKCIASIAKTKFPHPIEIIVVNNNSADATQQTMDKLHIKGLFERNQGCGPARQLGQENAQGKYILLADADCLYPPQWVNEMYQVLSRPNVVCVYGRYSFISEPGFPRWQLFILEKLKDIVAEFRQLYRPYFNTYGLSMGYIRELGLKVGFITTKFWGDDGQLCLGLMKYGKVKQVRSHKARVWTGPRTLQRDGSLYDAFMLRIKRELKRFHKYFGSKLPDDARHKSKSGN
ncbi:Glycosyl transferase family 2 [bacterium A37T11]|nr:Glycosyl transferase family 2 [bacterium A37T11]